MYASPAALTSRMTSSMGVSVSRARLSADGHRETGRHGWGKVSELAVFLGDVAQGFRGGDESGDLRDVRAHEEVGERVRDSVQLGVDCLELAHGHGCVNNPHEREWGDDRQRGGDGNEGRLGDDSTGSHDGGTNTGAELHERRGIGRGHEESRGDCRGCGSGGDGGRRRGCRAEDLRGDCPGVGGVLACRGEATRQACDEGITRAPGDGNEPLVRLTVGRRDGELYVVRGGR